MRLTLQDLRDALKGQRKAEEAIFWFAFAWNSGKDSDLYHVMCDTDFHPRWMNPNHHFVRGVKNPDGSPRVDDSGVPVTEYDPEFLYCWDVLGKMWQAAYDAPIEYAKQPVRLLDVSENDVVIHTNPRTFACIVGAWPCRVYLWNNELGVACAEGPHGASFHRFITAPTVGELVRRERALRQMSSLDSIWASEKADANGYIVGFRR